MMGGMVRGTKRGLQVYSAGSWGAQNGHTGEPGGG